MKHYLFAYGILKNDGKLIAKDVEIQGRMYDLGSFPAITTIEDPLSRAIGNVIEIDESMLKTFDCIEGVDHENPKNGMYRREFIFIPELDKAVWIYIYNNMKPIGKLVREWNRRAEYERDYL